MDEKKKSAEQTALGDELDRILGPKEFKVLGQDLALGDRRTPTDEKAGGL